MKKRINLFDAVTLLSIFAMLFSVGLHLGKPKRSEKTLSAEITVNVVKIKLSEIDEDFFIDGKYGCELIGIEGNTLRLLCSGKQREAGFLMSGAKYLSKNQPIEIKSDSSYIYGRITEIALSP